jgi:hypothetical protein
LIAHSIASAPELAEEHKIGEALLAQPRGEPLAVRALEQVRHVPELGGLLLQRRDQMRMRVAERVHRDAGGEIEIALAVLGEEVGPLAPLERDIGPVVGRQNRGKHWTLHDLVPGTFAKRRRVYLLNPQAGQANGPHARESGSWSYSLGEPTIECVSEGVSSQL